MLIYIPMKKVGFVYDNIFLEHKTPEWHPESKSRLVAIINKLKNSGMWDKLVHIKPIHARREDIEAVHTHEYVEMMSNFNPGYADPDTYISEKSIEAAFYAAGAVMEAVNKCKSGEIDRAFCAVRPPGHHAEKDQAMGFCIFNNIAVGARYAQKKGYEKIFIVDFDVHHGNGTQHMFEEDDSVFYFSTHQYPHYPGTGSQTETGADKGKGFTHNVPMIYGAGVHEYSHVYQKVLPSVVKGFAPDMIMVSAGYDIHDKDPLSGIQISNEGIRDIVKGIMSCSHKSNGDIPVIFTLEGGYDLQALADSVLITLEEMLH